MLLHCEPVHTVLLYSSPPCSFSSHISSRCQQSPFISIQAHCIRKIARRWWSFLPKAWINYLRMARTVSRVLSVWFFNAEMKWYAYWQYKCTWDVSECLDTRFLQMTAQQHARTWYLVLCLHFSEISSCISFQFNLRFYVTRKKVQKFHLSCRQVAERVQNDVYRSAFRGIRTWSANESTRRFAMWFGVSIFNARRIFLDGLPCIYFRPIVAVRYFLSCGFGKALIGAWPVTYFYYSHVSGMELVILWSPDHELYLACGNATSAPWFSWENEIRYAAFH